MQNLPFPAWRAMTVKRMRHDLGHLTAAARYYYRIFHCAEGIFSSAVRGIVFAYPLATGTGMIRIIGEHDNTKKPSFFPTLVL
jgi:hypothetical protein